MKGKGKSHPALERPELKESKDVKPDCPLLFPDFKPVDHGRMCPRYTAVLGRSQDDGIGAEELDTLQTEMETLLAAAAKRMRQLESEMSKLAGWQESKLIPTPQRPEKGKGKSLDGKRSGGKDDKPSKKFKETSGKAVLPPTPVRNSKGKSQQVTPKLETPERNTDSPKPPQPKELPKVAKNDAPNRFWGLVEPYCADLAIEDLRVLEDILRSHEDDVEYYKVPSLGKHYAHKWAQEDMLEEQKEGLKSGDKRRSVGLLTGTDGLALMKKANSEDRKSSTFPLPVDLHGDEDASPFGPLTQRLVSALIEENIMTPPEEANIEVDAADAATMSPRLLAKQLNIGNTAQLERRIRRELEEHGILEDEESKPDDGGPDEVLAELRRKQQELRVLSQANLVQTKQLYKQAKDEMNRQDLRRKMAAVDADVIDALRKAQASKLKKRTPTKKERDTATKALKDREAILRSLEDLG